jgi:outer membrane protein OmpA-like peptidoglycan-associated protein
MRTTNAFALAGAVLLAALWNAPRVVAKPVDRPLVVAQAQKKNDAKPHKATKQQPPKTKKPQVQKNLGAAQAKPKPQAKPRAAQAKPKPQAKPKAVQAKPKPARQPTVQAKPKPAPAKPKAAQAKSIDASAQAQTQDRQKPDAAKQKSDERRTQKRDDRGERNKDRKPAAAQQEKKAAPQKPPAAQQQKKDEPQKPAAAQQQKKDEPQKPAARQQDDNKSSADKATNQNDRKSAAPDQRQRNAAPSDRDRDNTRSRPAADNDRNRNRADQDRDRDRNRADQDRDRDRNARDRGNRDRGDNDRNRANRDRDSAAAAQQAIKPKSADEFILRKGEKRQRGIADVRRERRETREGNRIVIHEGDRRIVKQDNRVIIRHREAERFAIGARNVDVRRQGGEITTVVMRPNGMRIINVTDDDGHLIRRVRRDSRGREVVIIDNRYHGGRRPDIFINVRPPRFHGHRDRYIVEAWRVPPPRIYEVFTAQPIEPLERRYTLAQVRYSEPLREYMPRVDLEINFESGSWQITPDQIAELSAIANGLNQAIDQNPDEVFLIEGYTDAVGAEEDNLSLSDRRAETVAVALTQEFNVPPENLVTQGYGEEQLKVETEGPNRTNRRVSIRRITPLLDKVTGR